MSKRKSSFLCSRNSTNSISINRCILNNFIFNLNISRISSTNSNILEGSECSTSRNYKISSTFSSISSCYWSKNNVFVNPIETIESCAPVPIPFIEAVGIPTISPILYPLPPSVTLTSPTVPALLLGS